MDNVRSYLLAIKRNNKDYLPLEFNLTKEYQGEDLTTLEGIDNFTKKLFDVDLIMSSLDSNIVDATEKFQSFVIIYKDKNKYRELKDGPIFKNDENILNIDYIANTIVNLLDNKDFINHIYNLKDRFINQLTLELVYLIKNVNYLYNATNKPQELIKNILEEMPYEDRRIISRIVYEKTLNNKKKQEHIMKYKNVAQYNEET